jgi:TonB family protein
MITIEKYRKNKGRIKINGYVLTIVVVLLFSCKSNIPVFNNDTSGYKYAEFAKYMSSQITYPEEARINNIEGRVLVAFAVDKDGTIVDAKIIKSVHSLLDTEALRIVNSMPKWEPASRRGKPIKVKFKFPVNFKL